MPARYEPFGLAVLEAALSGCALVLADIPSLREIWGDAGVFVATDNCYAIADALEMLIQNDRLRIELSARARRRALDFSPARMAEAYLTGYTQCRGQESIGVAA